MSLRGLKTLLWFLCGAGLTVILLRIIHGPGSVVALTDIIPWGLWKGGGVVALVPIGGAGFTLAAMVYIFHWKRYQVLARGAVLLGLVCYSSVAAGLTFDIGIWWRIVYPLFYWQFHSTLFEIAWCIMLYLGVLAVEFSHAIVEKFNMPRLRSIIEKTSIVFVIAGISLSTLHQSSLGTMFLATPYRLHPLWHTDWLPGFFLLTSIGLGCLTISWLTLVVFRLYKVEQPMDAISGLGRIAAVVLGFYGLLKFVEILIAGEGALLLTLDWNVANFWFEILLSALIPVALLAFPRFRQSATAMFWIASTAIVGMSLNRVNVAGLATLDATSATYFPIWPEWAVTLGILSFAGLVYLFCVERFEVFSAIDEQAVKRVYASEQVDHADWKTLFFRIPHAESRLYSAVFVLAMGLALGCVPDGSVFGEQPQKTPVTGSRVVEVAKVENPQGPGSQFMIGAQALAEHATGHTDVFVIDANRQAEFVLFDHESHIDGLVAQGADCSTCHHMNKPYDKATGCHQCHADMYLETDIFNHDLHQKKLGNNAGCAKCHVDDSLPKVRKNTTACAECHPGMRQNDAVGDPQKRNLAPGYMDAMHGLCIGCHQERKDTLAEKNEDFARCTQCHRDTPGFDSPAWNDLR